jgi:hypothetical protein
MAIVIDEPVKVAAVFSRGTIRPVWFAWNGRQVRIKETTFIWTTFEGSSTVHHFSVSDGKRLYEICFQSDNLHWRLARAEEGTV